ncbi:DUF3954 domain-containing protein [Edaphobacillus lindanitolerans]
MYIIKDGKTMKVTPPATGFRKQVLLWGTGRPTRSGVGFTERG